LVIEYIAAKTNEMLTYRHEIVIHKPMDEVIRVFRNRETIALWQPGLLSSELMESHPYPKYKLLFQFGRRKMEMTETILRDELPAHFDGTYKMKGVLNTIRSSFENVEPSSTRWVSEVEFKFTGLMKIIAYFMKDDFKKQSEIIMSNFKKFVEL